MYEELLVDNTDAWIEIVCKPKASKPKMVKLKKWNVVAKCTNRRTMVKDLQRLRTDNPDNEYRLISVTVTRKNLYWD